MSVYSRDIVRIVLEALEAGPVLQYLDYRTETVQTIGDTLKCFCPIHQEQVFRTLTIDASGFRCSYSMCPGSKGGDLVQLAALVKKQEYDEALRGLVEHFAIDVELPPTSEYVERALEIAENYLELGELDDAEAEFKKAEKLEPGGWSVAEGLAEIYRQRGDAARLQPQLERLLELAAAGERPADAEGKAASYAQELLGLDPQNVEVRLQLAEDKLAQGQEEAAVGDMMRAAEIHEERGDFAAAVAVYHRIQELGLSLIDVTPHLTQALVSAGRAEEAVEETLKQARLFSARERWDDALSCFKQALDLDDSRDGVRRELVAAALAAGLGDAHLHACFDAIDHYLKQEAPSAAEEVLEQVKTQLPHHTLVIQKEIEILRRRGRDDRAAGMQLDLTAHYVEKGALREAQALLEALARQTGQPPEVLSRIAEQAAAIGDSKLARAMLLKRVELDRAEHRTDDVLAAYDRLIELSPEQPELLLAPIQFLLESRLNERAVRYSEQLVAFYEERKEWLPLSDALLQGLSLDPARVEWRERLAETYALLGQHDRAAENGLEAAQALLGREDWARALEAAARVLNWRPRHPLALELTGRAYLGLGQPPRAFEAWRELAARHIEEQNHEAAARVLDQIERAAQDAATAADDAKAPGDDGQAASAESIEILQLRAALHQSAGDVARLTDTLHQLTEAFIRRESHARAIETANQALDHNPDDVRAIEQLARVYDATQKADGATEARLRLCDVHHRRREYEREMTLCREMIEADPANWRARQHLIEALVGTHRLEEAIPAATEFIDRYGEGQQAPEAIDVANVILKYNPDNLEIQRRLTQLYRRQGATDKWAAQATQLISCYSRRKLHDEIAALYEELVAAAPGNINFRINLIAAYIEIRQLSKARAQYLELAQYYLDRDNLEDAAATLHQALDCAPEDEGIMDRLAEVHARRGQTEEQVALLGALSDLHVRHGRTEDALEALRRIVEADPANADAREKQLQLSSKLEASSSQVRERQELSAVLLEQGRVDEAIGHLREAVKIRPDETTARRQLVRVLLDHGRPEEATRELWAMAHLHQAADNHQDVLRCLNEILQNGPRDLEARKMRAETYAKMGQEKEALEEFMRISGELQTPLPEIRTAAAATGPEPESMPVVAEYIFDEFIVGDNNNFACATCQAVAKAPARHYNPVFIWSDVGLGKTHLINAIANYLRENEPGLKQHYTNAEEFTGQLIDAIGNNTLTALRNYYKRIDVLLVDDIQFLAGKEKAQGEFFHVFNALFQAKRQIVVTSDRPPKDMAHLEKRLRSRFGAGVIVDIGAPDLETRMAILRKEAAAYPGVEIDGGVIQKLSEKIDSNVRALKAAFNQLMAQHQVQGRPIDDKMVETVLAQVFETA